MPGRALQLQGDHHLALPNDAWWENLTSLSVMAWVVPTDLSAYREILRKRDGQRTRAFSFQDHGRILSLGLNIEGEYVECDALQSSRQQVLDGTWHHVAATFDGWKDVRIPGWPNGRHVGVPGPNSLSGGSAQPYLGSLAGRENFRGKMDELLLFDRALSAGADSRPAGGRECWNWRDRIRSWQQPWQATKRSPDFAETLSAVIDLLRGQEGQTSAATARAILARLLEADFPEESRKLREYTGLAIGDFLSPPWGQRLHGCRRAGGRPTGGIPADYSRAVAKADSRAVGALEQGGSAGSPLGAATFGVCAPSRPS